MKRITIMCVLVLASTAANAEYTVKDTVAIETALAYAIPEAFPCNK